MNIDERYRAAEDEAQLEYIKQWRERKRKKKDRRKDCKEIGKEHLAVSLKERFWAWCLSFPFWLFPIIYLARYNK